MTAKTYKGGVNDYSTESAWSPSGKPQPGDFVFINSGILTASNSDLDGQSIDMRGPSTLDLVNGGLAVGTTISTVGESGDVALNITGRGLNFGLIKDESENLNISVGPSSTFDNYGTVDAALSAFATFLRLNSGPADRVTNYGVLRADGLGNSPGGSLFVAGDLFDNTNGMVFASGGTIDINSSIAISNSGGIAAYNAPNGHGALDQFQGVINITFGISQSRGSFVNSGTISVGQAALLDIADAKFISADSGTLVNSGLITSGGNMVLDTPVEQIEDGRIIASAGGKIIITRGVDGGIVQLDRATLEFGGTAPTPNFIGPRSGQGFRAPLHLAGPVDVLTFDYVRSVAVTLTGNDLLVTTIDPMYGEVAPIAHLHLTGGTYTADEFTVQGTSVIYKPSTLGPTETPTPTPTLTPPIPDPAPPSPTNFTINGVTKDDGAAYSGPAQGVQHQYINVTSASLAITAMVPNSFIHTGSGDDAIDVSHAGGTNVLDGSTGSNFLVGGTGNDTFFVDDRGATADIWSSIAGFHAGDHVTVWGVTAADFALKWQDGQGAAGNTGLTGSFTKAGVPRANVTLVGYTTADIGTRLTVSFGVTADQPGAPGSAFMSIAGR